MADNSPLLRPLQIAAGGLGCVQAFTWGILSLLGILAYCDVIKVAQTVVPSDSFKHSLMNIYFNSELPSHEYCMMPGTVVIWTSLYFSTSIIWLAISGFLLKDVFTSKFDPIVMIAWVAITAVVSVIDFAATISFGVDYGKMQYYADTNVAQQSVWLLMLPVPIFMMTLSARGFVLWIINVGLTIYLGMAARQQKQPTSKQPPLKTSRQPSLVSMYSSTALNTYEYNKGRQNSGFQPGPETAWNVQSPTVGDLRRGPWTFPDNNSPRLANEAMASKVLPRVGRPVSTPVVPVTMSPVTPATPVAPLPIPQPDYSPILGRPVKHEPNLYDSPLRSALKKPNPVGRTIL